jgi:hypothetical protein
MGIRESAGMHETSTRNAAAAAVDREETARTVDRTATRRRTG